MKVDIEKATLITPPGSPTVSLRDGSLSFTAAGEPEDIEMPKHNVSFWKIYWIGFLIQLEGNVVFPTIYDYSKNHFGADIFMYGAILSVQAAAETLGALVLGFWSDRRPMKYPLMGATGFFILGNIIYVLAWDTNVYMLMLARFIAGLGFGGTSSILAFITHNSTSQQRNHKIAMYWLCVLSTNIFGPLLTFSIIKANVGEGSGIINRMTIPSLFNIGFYAINAFVIYKQWPDSISHHVSDKKAQMVMDKKGYNDFYSLLRTIPFVGFVFLYIKMVFSLMVSILQALASPISDADTSGNSIIFLVVGTVILIGVIMTKAMTRCISDYNILQTAQVLAFVSLFGLLRWPIHPMYKFYLFIISSIFLTLANSMGITICTASFSKAIGQNHPRKGTLMGWYITAAAFARILGPILSCLGFQTVGLNVIGSILIGLSVIALVMVSFSRLRMYYLQHSEARI